MLYPAELRARIGGALIEGCFGSRKPLRAGKVISTPILVIRAFALLSIAALAGCAKDTGHYPSLSPRPIERVSLDEPAAPPPAPARPDPALDARLAEAARADADRKRRIEGALTDADRLVAQAAGMPAGSDRWLDAHIALGTLDGLRAETSEALTALEQEAADRGVAGEPPYPALDDAIERLRSAAAGLTARIDALQQRLAR